jgi:hypothetical protein
MPIIKDCELYYCKLNPKKPNNRFNKDNPTWECQIRTKDKAVKKLWEELALPVKAIVPDEGDPYFRVNLQKKSIKQDGEKASPIRVVNGKLEDLDPESIGNGSIGNIRLFQYEYPKKTGGKGIASVLMGIQVTKHIVYKPKPRNDEFDQTETETFDPDSAESENEDF